MQGHETFAVTWQRVWHYDRHDKTLQLLSFVLGKKARLIIHSTSQKGLSKKFAEKFVKLKCVKIELLFDDFFVYVFEFSC